MSTFRLSPLTLAYLKSSALVSDLPVPKNRSSEEISKGKIPNTYVPARNTLFLAYARGQAELLDAREIYAGPNALDAVPYPDCHSKLCSSFSRCLKCSHKTSHRRHSSSLTNSSHSLGKSRNYPTSKSFKCSPYTSPSAAMTLYLPKNPVAYATPACYAPKASRGPTRRLTPAKGQWPSAHPHHKLVNVVQFHINLKSRGKGRG